jgi:hypothetical protein
MGADFGGCRDRLVGMVKRTAEAESLLAEFNSELADSAAQAGMALKWTVADEQNLEALGDCVDRRVWLKGRLDAADPTDTRTVVKLCAEWRQTIALEMRLLKSIDTSAPQPESLRTIKARRAAMRRWHPNATG